MIGKRIGFILLTLSVLAGCQSAPSQQDLQLADVTSMEKVKNYDRSEERRVGKEC